MAGHTEIDLVTGRATLGLRYRLRPMVVLAPRDYVITRLHVLMALVAGVTAIARYHGVAAGAGRGGASRIGCMIAAKRLGVIGGSLGRWHVGARSNGAQAGIARHVAGLAAAHALLRCHPLLIVVTTHADLHDLRRRLLRLLGLLHDRGVTAHAGNACASAIAAMGTVTKFQVPANEGARPSLLAPGFVTALAGVHRRAAGFGGLVGMTAGTGSMAGTR